MPLFNFGVVVCVTLKQFWSLFQFQQITLKQFSSMFQVGLGVVFSLQCSGSILVLLFMQHSNNFGHCFNFGLGVALFSAMLLFNFGVVVHAMLQKFWSLFQFHCCFKFGLGVAFFHDTLVSPLSFNGPLPELGITFHLHYISFALHLKILPHQHEMHDTSRFKCHALHLHFMK